MGTRNMPWADWIEVCDYEVILQTCDQRGCIQLDNQYQRYQMIRAQRIETQGEGVVQVLDDNANPEVKGGNLAGKAIGNLKTQSFIPSSNRARP